MSYLNFSNYDQFLYLTFLFYTGYCIAEQLDANLKGMDTQKMFGLANNVDLQLPTGRYKGSWNKGKKVGLGAFFQYVPVFALIYDNKHQW